MAAKEVLEVLDEMRNAYNSGNFDFSKWHPLPLLIIEDSGHQTIGDSVLLERVFETLVNCSRYLDLSHTDYSLQSLQVMSDKVAVTKVRWDFSNNQKKTELILEIGHIMQKQDNGWKITALLQPLWREPWRERQDIKRMDKGGDGL